MRLALNPDQERLIRTVRDALSPGQACFLVGGAVRDYLLGRPLHDLDFALPENPTQLARRTAKKLNAGYFVLDDQRHTARVVYQKQDGRPFPLDFVQFTGETLEADLRNRDFTLNAMALAVDDLDTVIDPVNGQADLRQKVLRPCTPHALVDDPVRILRAVRLAKQFSLAYDAGLSELAQAAARNLPNTSAERQRDELFKILEGPDAAGGIADADRFGVFTEMIPNADEPGEEEAARSRFDQALSTMTYFQTILKILNPSDGKPLSPESPLGMLAGEFELFRKQIHDYFSEEITPGREKSSLVLFGLLLIAKGVSGATPELTKETARRYQLSNAEAGWVQTLVIENRAVDKLAGVSELPSREDIYHYYQRSGKTGVAIAILHLADMLAAPGHLAGSNWKLQLDIVFHLFEAWWDRRDELVSPQPLLNGNEIQREFNLTPGALIGELLTALKEAQAIGEVKTQEDARKFIVNQIQTR